MGGSQSTAVSPVFGRSSSHGHREGGNNHPGLSLVKDIEAGTDLPYADRPPILAAFLDLEQQDDQSGLIIVCSSSIENWSRRFGFRKHRRKYEGKDRLSIVACDALPRQTSTSALLIAVGLNTGQIEIVNSFSLEVKCSLAASVVPSLLLTQIKTPIPNVVICGYSDGSVRSFFINSGKLGSSMQWPSEYLGVFCPPSCCSPSCEGIIELHGTPIQKSEITLERHPRRVTALAFSPQLSWLAVGYEGCKKLTNLTADGQTALVDHSSPVTLYSIVTEKLILTLEPTDGTVVFISTTQLPLLKGSKPVSSSPLYLTAVTPTSFSIWQLPGSATVSNLLALTDSPQHQQHAASFPLRVRHSSLSTHFSNTVIDRFNCGRCVSAVADTVDSVLFLLFEFGFVVSIALSTSPIAATEEVDASENVRLGDLPTLEQRHKVNCLFYRFMKVGLGLFR